jgi:hypothetical protein
MYNQKALNHVQTRLPDFSVMCHYTKFDMASVIFLNISIFLLKSGSIEPAGAFFPVHATFSFDFSPDKFDGLAGQLGFLIVLLLSLTKNP